MLYALLLLIIAILLFGSSRISGAVGIVSGFIALSAALAVVVYFSSPLLAKIGLNKDQMPAASVLFFIGIIVVARLFICLKERK